MSLTGDIMTVISHVPQRGCGPITHVMLDDHVAFLDGDCKCQPAIIQGLGFLC